MVVSRAGMARFLLGSPPPSLHKKGRREIRDATHTPTKMMSNGQLSSQDACVRGPVGEPRPSNLQTRVFRPAGPGLSHTCRYINPHYLTLDSSRDAEEKKHNSAPAPSAYPKPRPPRLRFFVKAILARTHLDLVWALSQSLCRRLEEAILTYQEGERAIKKIIVPQPTCCRQLAYLLRDTAGRMMDDGLARSPEAGRGGSRGERHVAAFGRARELAIVGRVT